MATMGQIHKEWSTAVNDSLFRGNVAAGISATSASYLQGFCRNDKQVQKSSEMQHLSSQEHKLQSGHLAAIGPRNWLRRKERIRAERTVEQMRKRQGWERKTGLKEEGRIED